MLTAAMASYMLLKTVYLIGLPLSFLAICVLRFKSFLAYNIVLRSGSDGVPELLNFVISYVLFYMLGSLIYAVVWPLGLPYVFFRDNDAILRKIH